MKLTETRKGIKKPVKIILWILVLLGMVLCMARVLPAQTTTTSDGQLWLDAELNYTFKERWLLQNVLCYQTLLWGDSSWSSYDIHPEVEYNICKYLDIIMGGVLSYTRQTDTYDTYEIRYMTGARIYFTPCKRIQTRLLVRWEYRWKYDLSTSEWSKGNRFRLRAELVVPLNKDTYFADKVWYLINDVEVFLWQGSEIRERYANRVRVRIGLGYRLNHKIHFEAIYTDQYSRNQLDDEFNAHSDIIRLRMKYYFK